MPHLANATGALMGSRWADAGAITRCASWAFGLQHQKFKQSLCFYSKGQAGMQLGIQLGVPIHSTFRHSVPDTARPRTGASLAGRRTSCRRCLPIRSKAAGGNSTHVGTFQDR